MPDPPLTPAQLLYLEAFDRFLRARSMRDRSRARESMSVRLNFVLGEANLDLPNDTRWSDSIGWERDPNRTNRERRVGRSVRARRQRRVNGRFSRRAA